MAKRIPTPKYVEESTETRRFPIGGCVRVAIHAQADERIAFAVEYLRKRLHDEFGLGMEQTEENADLLLTDKAEEADVPQACFRALDRERFAQNEGYLLSVPSDGPILLYGKGADGCRHAVVSLLGEMERRDDSVFLPCVRIADAPDFQYRGNTWLLYTESSGLGYDFGDGLEEYERRFVEKLDLCVRYKINLLLVDGLGWSLEKYPGYPTLMRRLNTQARRRGIHLMTSGYGAGYGAAAPGNGNLHQGKVHMNLDPETGETYVCQWSYGRQMTQGSCLSNDRLFEEKAKELTEFVRECEPGALYIHHLDAAELTFLDWDKRCPACRKRWPNDDLCAEDGCAGAYAEFYSRMARRLKSVRNDDGYDASRDLLMMFISPGYTWYYIDDGSWEMHVRFWSVVGKLLEKENVFIGLREQYYDQETRPRGTHTRRRFARLRTVFDRECPDAKTGVIYFGGSDNFYSDRLFNTVPLYHESQLGVEMLLNADGNAFQEPLQLLNAEYMWNSRHSAWGVIPEAERPENYFASMAAIKRAGFGQERPEGIYGAGGFLECACEQLYGKRDGAIMAAILRLSGTNGEQPIGYLRNVDIVTSFNQNPPLYAWHNELDEDVAERIEQVILQALKVTEQAAALSSPLLEWDGVDETARFMAENFAVNVPYLKTLSEYMVLRRELLQWLQEDPDPRKKEELREGLDRIAASGRRLWDEFEQSGLRPFDYMGAAFNGRRVMADFFMKNAAWMKECMEERKRLPKDDVERQQWW